MKLKLEQLKPNPFRDTRIDPVDNDAVAALQKSINEFGFWSGTVARKNKRGEYEVAAGWTRVVAALKENETEAEIFIANYDDHAMVRAYVTENATQRGNTATALAGAIATAIMEIAKLLINDDVQHLAQICATSRKAIETARGNLMNGHGVGHELIEAYLRDVPGIKENVIKDQLASLKSSGHYARLISTITEQIAEAHANEAQEVELLEQEAEDETKSERARIAAQQKLNQKPLHVARRTAQHVEKKEVTFDYEVAKQFKNPSQVRAFRTTVASERVRHVLPVANQAALAKELVRVHGKDVSAEVIKDQIGIMAGDAKFRATQVNKKQLEEALQKNVRENFARHLDLFCRSARGMFSEFMHLRTLVQENPKIEFHIGPGARKNIEDVQKVLDDLHKLLPDL